MTPEQIRRIEEILAAYDAEPQGTGSDEATERDLGYFDQIVAVYHGTAT